MHRRSWLLANLLFLAVGCIVPNPAYERSLLVDAGAGEHEALGPLDSRGPVSDAGAQSDGSVDIHKEGGTSLDVAPGTPDLAVGDGSSPAGGDALPVVTDATQMTPDLVSAPPDVVPAPPDVSPVVADARVDLVAPPVDMNPVPVGTGLLAQYFDGSELEKGDTGKLVLQRTDATIDFDWGTGRVVPDIDDDWFSVRWTGQVMPLHSETYTFRTVTDEGVRLWVNGVRVIDSWGLQQSVSRTGTPITLDAYKKYDIRMEYFEQTGAAVAHLYWSSPSQPSQIVPRVCLFAP